MAKQLCYIVSSLQCIKSEDGKREIDVHLVEKLDASICSVQESAKKVPQSFSSNINKKIAQVNVEIIIISYCTMYVHSTFVLFIES